MATLRYHFFKIRARGYYSRFYTAITGVRTTLEDLLKRSEAVWDLTRLINLRQLNLYLMKNDLETMKLIFNMRTLVTVVLLGIILAFSAVGSANSQPAQGDWVVAGVESVENKTITLNGNLIVKAGGSLTLRGVTLIVNSRYIGQYQISAEPGSSLYIYNSTIVPGDERYGPILIVTGAKFIMKHSKLQGSRGEWYYEAWKGGEWFTVRGADSPIIENNTITMFEYNRTKLLHLAMWGVESAIHLLDLRNAIIRNNVIASGGNVKLYIFLENSHNTTLTGNTMEFSDFILQGSWNSYIANNNMGLRGGSGLVISTGCGNNVVDNNRLTALSEYGGICRAFSLVNSPFPNAFTNNIVKGGIYDRDGDSNLEGMGFLTGVLISQSSNAIIANNSLIEFPIGSSGHNEAMQIYRSDNNLILNNYINSTNSGIILFASSNNSLKGNRVSNSGRGIGFYYSSDNNIVENNTLENNLINIVFDDAENNIVRTNVLGASERQGYDDGDNFWSRNYFSDYMGVDRGDGIGNIPYAIPPKATDNTPLMSRPLLKPVLVPALQPAPFEDVFSEMPLYAEHIFDERVLKNQVMTLNRSINLEEGSSLTLENVTLIAGPSRSFFSYAFCVKAGASLYIYRSKIIGGEKGPAILIQVDKGGKLVIKDSELYNLGDPWTQVGPGIQVNTDGAVIENNIIAGCKGAIVVFLGSNIRIVNNTISKCLHGIFINGMEYSSLMGNRISEVAHNSLVPQVVSNCIVVGNRISEVWGYIGHPCIAYAPRFHMSNSLVVNNTIINYLGGFPGKIGVDLMPPKVEIVRPSKGEHLKGALSIAISSEDEESGVERVDLYIDGLLTSSITQAPYEIILDTTKIGDGSHRIKAVAYDNAGNEESEEIYVTVDNTAPIAEILTPAHGAYVQGTLNITFRYYDANLQDAVLSVDSAKHEVTGRFFFSLDTKALPDGVHKISLNVTDKAGNSKEFSIDITIDNTIPTVAITSPKEGGSLIGTIGIMFTAADAQTSLEKLILKIDSAVYDVTGKTLFSWDTSTVGDGAHTIILTATDKAGNTASTPITVVTVNVKTILMYVLIITTLAFAASSVYFAKKKPKTS